MDWVTVPRTLSVADRVPGADGVIVNLPVQEAPASIVPPSLQVPPAAPAKSAAFVPVKLNQCGLFPSVIVVLPVLVTVSVSAALVTPSFVAGNINPSGAWNAP